MAENNRRVSNGDQVNRIAALALKRGKSVDLQGIGNATLSLHDCVSLGGQHEHSRQSFPRGASNSGSFSEHHIELGARNTRLGDATAKEKGCALYCAHGEQESEQLSTDVRGGLLLSLLLG